jgi:hypothetical protein
VVEEYLYLRLLQPVAVDLLSYMRLEVPSDRFVIVPAHAFKELAGHPANHRLVGVVSLAQSAGNHSPDVPPRLQQRDARALLGRRDRRHRSASRPAVYHYIVTFRRRSRATRRNSDNAQQCKHANSTDQKLMRRFRTLVSLWLNHVIPLFADMPLGYSSQSPCGA